MRFRLFILLILFTMIGPIRQKPDGFMPIVPSYPTIPTANISQQFGHLGHVGIDFRISVGTPIYADYDGTVIKEIENDPVYGRCLMIKHEDGYVSLYGHLAAFEVKPMEIVYSGDLIALSGGDPNDKIDGDGQSTGPHLHWEIRPPNHTDTNKYNIDPMKFVMSMIHEKYEVAYVNSEQGVKVHLGPDINSPVITLLCNKDEVKIVEEKNGWARSLSLRPEWVSLSYIRK